jgi:hypothetical protein
MPDQYVPITIKYLLIGSNTSVPGREEFPFGAPAQGSGPEFYTLPSASSVYSPDGSHCVYCPYFWTYRYNASGPCYYFFPSPDYDTPTVRLDKGPVEVVCWYVGCGDPIDPPPPATVSVFGLSSSTNETLCGVIDRVECVGNVSPSEVWQTGSDSVLVGICGVKIYAKKNIPGGSFSVWQSTNPSWQPDGRVLAVPVGQGGIAIAMYGEVQASGWESILDILRDLADRFRGRRVPWPPDPGPLRDSREIQEFLKFVGRIPRIMEMLNKIVMGPTPPPKSRPRRRKP